MKRFTLFMFAFMMFAAVFAQSKVSDLGVNNPRFNGNQAKSTNDACTESVASNAFENGYSSSSALDYRSAADLFVNGGDTYSLSQVVINVFSMTDITSVDLHFFDDNAGLPGTEIGNVMALAPTSDTVIGNNFGYDIHEVVLDLPAPFDFVAGTDLTAFYIMTVTTNADASNNFWEVTSAENYGGTPSFRSDDQGATWYVDPDGMELVYQFNGDCGGVPYIPPTGCTYYQDFEGTDMPADWSTQVVSGSFDWTFGSNYMPGGTDFYTNAAVFDDDSAGSGETNLVVLYSPVFDLDATNSTFANFSVLAEFQEYGDQEFSIWAYDGTDWQQLLLLDQDTDLQTYNFDVTPYINSMLQIAFVFNDDPDGDGTGSWGWGAGIDDFCMKYDEIPDAPVNDCPDGAIDIACGDVVSGDTTNATICEAVEDCDEYPNNPTTSPGVWYKFVCDGNMSYTFSTCDDADYDTSIGIYSGTPGSLTCVMANDDGTNCSGYSSLLEGFTGNDGETYYVRVYGWSNTSVGTFNMTVTCEPIVGTEENFIDGFQMNPNPVEDMLSVKAAQNIDLITVYNMMGQKVLETAPALTETQIDMSNLTSGAYIVKVQAGEQTGSYNLIKK